MLQGTTSRVLAGILGCWVFTLGLVSMGTLLMVRAGVGYADARTLMYLLSALLFLIAFLWTFAARRMGRVWAVLGGGGIALTGVAWWLAR